MMDLEMHKMEKGKRKPHIFLAGDSTMQAYTKDKRPQYGWGERLHEYLDGELLDSYHRLQCVFEQQRCFESERFIIDNCGMAGRSLKSFIRENRHLDIFSNIKAHDWLIIQFAHNDIARDKPERYTPIEELKTYYEIILSAARKQKVNLIVLAPILIDIYSHEEATLHPMVKDIKAYVAQIKTIAAMYDVPFVDVATITKKILNYDLHALGTYYLEDHVHLNMQGANLYAKVIGDAIRQWIG